MSARQYLLILILAFSSLWTNAQYQISGQVTDESGNPIEGVDVFIHETHVGVLTDVNGKFNIESVKKGHYHLHVTFAGYHAEQRDIDVTESVAGLQFVLEESINELHEVII